MQPITVIVLACLVAVVVASVDNNTPAEEQLYETGYDTPEYERSPRTKRGLLLLKKKLLIGALGLKVAKVGAGVAGIYALKKGHDLKSRGVSHTSISIEPVHPPKKYLEIHSHHGYPSKYVEVHRH